MNRVSKATKPIVADWIFAGLATLLWFTPANLKPQGLDAGFLLRLTGVVGSVVMAGKGYLASSKLQEDLATLKELDETDRAVLTEQYLAERTAQAHKTEAIMHASLAEELTPVESRMLELHQATLLPEVKALLEQEKAQAEAENAQAVQTATATPTPPADTPPEPTDKPAEAKANPDRLFIMLDQEQQIAWVPSEHSNGFFMCLGASGSGKTETLKVLGSDIHRFGVPVLVVDFHGDVTIEGVTNYVLSHGPASKFGINPMELASKDPNDGGVYAQVNFLLDLLKMAVDIGHRQWATLKTALQAAYWNAGIKDSEPSTWDREAPNFNQVLSILDAMYLDACEPTAPKGEAAIVKSAIDAVSRVFEHPVFNRKSQVSIEEILNQSTRLDLHHLEREIKFLVADTVLRKVSRGLRAKGPIPVEPKNDRERYRLFIISDESKLLTLGRDRDDPNAVLNIILTEDRKFGAAGVFASQIGDHFSQEGKAQIACRLILRPFDFKEAAENGKHIGLAPDALMGLRGRGHGWLSLGSAPKQVQITPMHKRTAPAPQPSTPAQAIAPTSQTPPPEPEVQAEGEPTPEELLKRWQARLEASWQASISDASPAASEPEPENPSIASSSGGEPEVVSPAAPEPEAAAEATSPTAGVIPDEEVRAALKRFYGLLLEAEVPATEIAQFNKLLVESHTRALWYGMRLIKCSQNKAILKVFGRKTTGGKDFRDASPWYKWLVQTYGPIV